MVEFNPKSLFGKRRYIEEQALTRSLVLNIASAVANIRPELVGIGFQLIPAIGSIERRRERARMFLSRAKKNLEEIGVI
jgi:hypothetical protein